MKWKKIGRGMLYFLAVLIVVQLSLLFLFQPSHNRDWELGQDKLPHVVYSSTSSVVAIENYRDFVWTDVDQAEARYKTETFDLSKIKGVDVFISHFADFQGLAHIFLSFGFTDGKHVVVSLETRREKDEQFSPWLGILRQYEIIYVVGSENDIAGLRTGPRGERVYLYPTIASPEQAKELFDELALAINDVYETPRMYNTLTHNCTNELTRPVEKISDVQFPLTWKTILPGYFDEVLYQLKLIDTGYDFASIKASHLLNNENLDERSESYSEDMRQELEAN